MKIVEMNVMHGPNYWSVNRHKLIVLKIDIGYLEHEPTNEIKGFARRLEKMFPQMIEHKGSENFNGGFFLQVKSGTSAAHVVEHIALALQNMAGMNVNFGRHKATSKKGLYDVIFEYEEEDAGVYAAESAVEIVHSLVNNLPYDVEYDVKKLMRIKKRVGFGLSTGSIVEEADKRGIPWIRLNDGSLVQLGYGKNQKRIQATMASTTNGIAVDIAGDKEGTKDMLQAAGIPTPGGITIWREEQLDDAIDEVGYPLVIKPLDGNHGNGITIDINTYEEALEAFHIAQEISTDVIVERFIKGEDYRLLVIDYKFVAAVHRVPPSVVGDGKSTIQELINDINSDPRRGIEHENILTQIETNDVTINILKKRGLTLDSVLPEGEKVFVKETGNISTGGVPIDVTDIVHPENIFMAERIASIIGLNICGIDLMAPDITVPVLDSSGAVVEVNAAPGFRMHIEPTEGTPRNVTDPIMNMLFPPGTSPVIPLVAVTGTNGKTTTVRLIAHLAQQAQYKVGYTTTDGIYINKHLISKGDSAGPKSAHIILKEPLVDFAVLECARGGILRSGLPFPTCDVGIVTNIAEDHMGLKGINTLADMAKVKAVVPKSVKKDGYAILNADDELVYAMIEELDCNVALFSLDENNEYIKKHCENNGLAAVVDGEFITIINGKLKTHIEKVAEIPVTFGGSARFMVQNLLPAVLTAYVNNFEINDIKKALLSFQASSDQTPGRMNIHDFGDFKVMIDYAHNPAGLKAVGEFIKNQKASGRTGIIAGVGDRRDEDIVNIGRLSAEIFDDIIIRNDKDLRGRTEEEIHDLVLEGINKVKKDMPVKIIPVQSEAIYYALDKAKKDAFITIFTDAPMDANQIVENYKKEKANGAMVQH